MKKNALRIMTLLISLMMLASQCFASELTLSASFDSVTGEISLSGSGDGIVSIRLTKQGTNPDDITDINLPVDMYQLSTNGSFTHRFYLPEGSADGVYEIYATDDTSSASASFIAYSKSKADGIVKDELNKASSKSDFIQIASDNAESLGIITDDTDHSDAVFGMAYDIKKTYTDSSDFYDTYNLAKAVCAIEGKDAESVKSAMQKYEKILGINYSDDFANNSLLSDSEKNALLKLLSDSDYAAYVSDAEKITGMKEFKAYYNANAALVNIIAANDASTAKKIYTADFAFLKENVVDDNSSYSKLSSTDVFSKLCTYSFSEFSDIKDNFDKAVAYVKDNEKLSAGGNSSGGGGWSAPAGSISGKYDELPGNTEDIPTEYATPSFASDKASYIDVASDAWYNESVTTLGGAGIINGYPDGTFKPDNLITRSEFAKLIVGAFSIKSAKKSFADVSADSWYEPYVAVASGAGIVNGDGTNFMPDSYITRQDAAVILYRTAALMGVQYNGTDRPDDIDNANIYAWTAIGSLYSNKIINGVDGKNFMPQSNITRAESAKLIYTLINDIKTR